MLASVVIPTFNRLNDLKRVVAAVEAERLRCADDVETVIVDDGSSDATWDWLSSMKATDGMTSVRQSNSGPAAARNRGVREAHGEIVLFLGDDTIPQPGWLESHLEEHRLFGSGEKLAVLGYTTFPSEEEGPFLRFINEYGAQFGYSIIDDPARVPFNFFYTSNISLPRAELLRLGGFREDFPAAAWEDIEFAYRAAGDGLHIRYQPLARTIHEHCVRPRTFCRRQRTSGLSGAIFAGLHPELSGFLGLERVGDLGRLSGARQLLLWILVEFGELIEGVIPAKIYQEFLDQCYLQGLAEGLHLRSAEVVHADDVAGIDRGGDRPQHGGS